MLYPRVKSSFALTYVGWNMQSSRTLEGAAHISRYVTMLQEGSAGSNTALACTGCMDKALSLAQATCASLLPVLMPQAHTSLLPNPPCKFLRIEKSIEKERT